jgi:hypothetical protein
MAGIRPVFEKGPLTFHATVADNGGNIRAGQLVMPDGDTGKIMPTTGAVPDCLGVALGDASASDFAVSNQTDAWGRVTVDHGLQPPNEVAVAYQGVWRLTVEGNVGFGDLVTSGADGVVVAFANAAAGSASNTGTVVGRCVEPGGIADGEQGKILLGGVGA